MKTPFSLIITGEEDFEDIIRERLGDLDIGVKTNYSIPKCETAKEEIEKLLDEQRELLEIINLSPAVVFLWKAEENWPVERVSSNISQFGYTVEDFTSGKVIFSSIIHPGDLERVSFEVEYNSDNNVNEFVQIYRILGKDKTEYWIEDFTHIRRNSQGEITHYQGIIIDISDRKKTEEELERASAVLKGVIESPKDVVIFALDREYRYQAFNENHHLTMKKIWGVDIATGRSMLDYVKNPEDCKKAKNNFDRALSGESFTVIEEYGDTALERRWYEDIYNPVTDEKGDVIGLAVFLTDITARKQMEDKIKESEYRFRELFNSMHSGVAIYRAVDEGADFVFVDFNHGAEIIENISKEDVIGRSVREVFPGIDEFGLLEVFRRVWKTGTPEHLPTSLYHDERIVSWRENFVYRLPSGEIVAIYDDVTEAKKAEQAIKASEARYHQLFESSPVSIWEEDFSEGREYLDKLQESGVSDFRKYFDDHPDEVLHLAGMARILDVNQATLDLMKAKSKEEFIHGLPEIFTPESIDFFKEELATIAEGGLHFKGESVHKTLSGDEIDVILNMLVAPGYEKSSGRILISLLDITARKRAEEALAKEKANVEYIIDSLPGMFYMFYMFDETGRFVRWNKNMETLTGYSEEEVAKMRPLEFIDDNYKEQISDAIKTAFSEGYADQEAVIVTKDGVKIPFFFSANRKIIDGTAYILGMGLDITKAKETEKEIRKLASVVRHSKELIALTKPEGVINFINEAGGKMIGVDVEDISKYHFMDFIPDHLKDKMNSEVLPTMAEKGSWEGDLQYTCIKTGDIIDVHAMTFIIKDPETDDPLYLANVSLNITERKKAEAALKEVNKKLNLLGSITRHDILNQVTVAQGYMEVLDMDGLLTKETELGEYCGKVMGAIDTIKRQIMFTKDYKDLGEQSPEWYNVGRIIDNTYRNTGFHTIQLVNETDDLEVYADPLFEKVIYNLFDNAVKHGEKITTIKFSFKKSGEDMDLICEDDGFGIPDEVKEKIFRREYYKHTGLGLFLSREILSITGLSIEENGKPGEGARFVIHIPKGLFRLD
ncbi:MAG: PAS domain S-box protein [Methanomicrobiaceae archaeon]|nr:PAS domain S-box protein [Methanomicrobiaceae archaeon]